jgi:hypothetical protein
LDGVQPITKEDLEKLTERIQFSISNSISGTLIGTIERNPNLNNIVDGTNSEYGTSVYHWDRRIHPVPRDFMLTRSVVFIAFRQYNFSH